VPALEQNEDQTGKNFVGYRVGRQTDSARNYSGGIRPTSMYALQSSAVQQAKARPSTCRELGHKYNFYDAQIKLYIDNEPTCEFIN
jgi:hypothetical protein